SNTSVVDALRGYRAPTSRGLGRHPIAVPVRQNSRCAHQFAAAFRFSNDQPATAIHVNVWPTRWKEDHRHDHRRDVVTRYGSSHREMCLWLTPQWRHKISIPSG